MFCMFTVFIYFFFMSIDTLTIVSILFSIFIPCEHVPFTLMYFYILLSCNVLSLFYTLMFLIPFDEFCVDVP